MLFSSKKCVFYPQKGLVNPTWVNHPFNKKKIKKKIFENSLGGFSSFLVSLHFPPPTNAPAPSLSQTPPPPTTTTGHNQAAPPTTTNFRRPPRRPNVDHPTDLSQPHAIYSHKSPPLTGNQNRRRRSVCPTPSDAGHRIPLRPSTAYGEPPTSPSRSFPPRPEAQLSLRRRFDSGSIFLNRTGG
jgi:hypothetical protein